MMRSSWKLDEKKIDEHASFVDEITYICYELKEISDNTRNYGNIFTASCSGDLGVCSGLSGSNRT